MAGKKSTRVPRKGSKPKKPKKVTSPDFVSTSDSQPQPPVSVAPKLILPPPNKNKDGSVQEPKITLPVSSKIETIVIKKPAKGKKRIYFFWYNLPHHTGARAHDFQIIQSLGNLKHDVISCTNSLPTFLNDYPSQKKIDWQVKDKFEQFSINKPDLIIASVGPYFHKALKAAKIAGCPIWVMAYGPESWYYEEVDEVFHDEQTLIDRYKQVDVILTSSELARNKFIDWIPGSQMKIEVVKPFINTNMFPKEPVGKELSITYVGRSQEYKGLKEFVQWSNTFKKKTNMNDLKINVIAPGSRFERERGHIVFEPHDNLSETEKFKIMKSTRVGVSMSKFETFGLVPAEFLLLGVPVVALDIPQLRSEYGNQIGYFNDVSSYINVLKNYIDGQAPVNTGRLAEDLTPEKMTQTLEGAIKRQLVRR